MQPISERKGQRESTFIEDARRTQIVEGAITVIAEHGYRNASLARIAQHLGISRGLISYHFSGKAELIAQVLVTVYTDAAAVMGVRVDAEQTPAGRLEAYVRSNIDYIRDNPARMVAVSAIITGGDIGNLPGIDHAAAAAQMYGVLEEVFREGQLRGEFRDFDVRVMARGVRALIDAVPTIVADENGIDAHTCAEELVTLIRLSTAKGSRS